MKLGKLLKDGSWIVFGVVAVDLSVDVLAVLTARLVFRDAVQLAIAVDDAVRIKAKDVWDTSVFTRILLYIPGGFLELRRHFKWGGNFVEIVVRGWACDESNVVARW